MDDVLLDGLEAGHLPALVAQLGASLAQTFQQITGKVGHGEETEKREDDFHLKRPQVHGNRRRGRQEAKGRVTIRQAGVDRGKIRELEQRPHANEAHRGHGERLRTREEDAGQEDHQEVQRDVAALGVARKVDDGGDNGNVQVELQVGLQEVVAAQLVVDEIEQTQQVPEDDGTAQVSEGKQVARAVDHLPDPVLNREDQRDDEEPYLDDPQKPGA